MNHQLRQLLPWIFAGLFLGGITHLTSILLMPAFAGQDATTRLMAMGQVNGAQVLSGASLPFTDPNSANAICVYDVSKAPLRIKIGAGDAYLSAVFLQKGGAAFYALNDRANPHASMDIVLANAEQMNTIEELDTEDQASQDLRVVTPSSTGVVLVRSVAKDAAHYGDAQSHIQTLKCELNLQ